MRAKPLVIVGLALLGLLAGGWFGQRHYAPRVPPPSATDQVWQLAYPDASGQTQALSQWRGQILVLNFWASWCAPCREEMPDFAALRRQYHDQGVEFVGIAVDNAANVAQFLANAPVNYPILIGEGAAQAAARQLGNPSGALPYTVVFDRQGQAVVRHLGRLPRASLETTLETLLTEAR